MVGGGKKFESRRRSEEERVSDFLNIGLVVGKGSS